MAAMDQALQKLMDAEFLIGQVRKELLDNKVVAGKATIASLNTKISGLKTDHGRM